MRIKRRKIYDFYDLPGKVRRRIKEIEAWGKKEVQGGIEGISQKCPYEHNDGQHDLFYRYTTYAGLLLMDCRTCGFYLEKQWWVKDREYTTYRKGEEEP